VLFLSSLFRWKGILVFLEAVGRARADGCQIDARVAGDWPSRSERDEAAALMRRLDLEGIVEFAGPVSGPEKTLLFRSADIFCFPSLVMEGQPLVILEAMAEGLPVVATAWPGIQDTVVDGDTGFLVSEPHPDEFARRIRQLADDPSLRRAMGDAGRARYAEHFTQAAFGERMARVIRPFLRPTVADAGRENA
jgi:glycosyltransferase involved in cell wall biosynthesis